MASKFHLKYDVLIFEKMIGHDDLSGVYSPSMFSSVFERQSFVIGHHLYKNIWIVFVGKTLACQKEENIMTDTYICNSI